LGGERRGGIDLGLGGGGGGGVLVGALDDDRVRGRDVGLGAVERRLRRRGFAARFVERCLTLGHRLL
jgi:hypothetical protein